MLDSDIYRSGPVISGVDLVFLAKLRRKDQKYIDKEYTFILITAVRRSVSRGNKAPVKVMSVNIPSIFIY